MNTKSFLLTVTLASITQVSISQTRTAGRADAGEHDPVPESVIQPKRGEILWAKQNNVYIYCNFDEGLRITRVVNNNNCGCTLLDIIVDYTQQYTGQHTTDFHLLEHPNAAAIAPPYIGPYSECISGNCQPKGGQNSTWRAFDPTNMGGFQEVPVVTQLVLKFANDDCQPVRTQSNNQTQTTQPIISAQSSGRTSSQLGSLDLQSYANRKFGSDAKVRFGSPNHIYAIKIVQGANTHNININDVVHTQLGSNYFAVMNGITGYDWYGVSISELAMRIVPVVIIPLDAFYNISDSREMSDNILTNLSYTQKWYENHMPTGKTFRFAEKAIFIYSDKSMTYWNKLAIMTDSGATPAEKEKNRYEYLNKAKNLVSNALPQLVSNNSMIICATVWVGHNLNASGAGAAASGNFVMQPPNVAVSRGAQHIYAIGHELGHAFGLPHSCDIYKDHSNPSCWESIMQNPGGDFKQKGTLLSEEQTILAKSPYFN